MQKRGVDYDFVEKTEIEFAIGEEEKEFKIPTIFKNDLEYNKNLDFTVKLRDEKNNF